MGQKTKYIYIKDLLWVLYLWISAVLVFLAIVFNINRAVAKDLVSIKNSAIVNGSKIYLKDISETKNPLIKDILIGNSPRPSKKTSISGYKIASILRSNKIPDDITIEVPETVVVQRNFQVVQTSELEKIFRKIVEKELKGKSIDISRIKVRGLIKYPTGKISFIPDIGRVKLSGNVSVPFEVKINGLYAGKIRINAWIDRFENIVFAGRNIKRDAIVKESDLILRKINVAKYHGDYISTIEEAIGKKVKRSIKKGTIIKERSVERAPLINKGSMVRLIASNGNLIVETVGRAKKDGYKGETILVENNSSKKVIMGKVIDKTTVSAFF